MTILGSWAEEIGDLNNRIHGMRAALGDLAAWDGSETLARLEERNQHLRVKSQWLKAELEKVRAMVGNKPSVITVGWKKGGRPDPEQEEFSEGFDAVLHRLERHHSDPVLFLKDLARQLKLTPEQIATLNLVEPSDPAFVAREKATKAEYQQFEQGKPMLFEAVEAYARKKGNLSGWPKREAMALYSKGIQVGKYPKTKTGLNELRRDLGQAGLLPPADRFAASWEEQVAKLKELVTL